MKEQVKCLQHYQPKEVRKKNIRQVRISVRNYGKYRFTEYRSFKKAQTNIGNYTTGLPSMPN
ncbi:hypothetical protein [Nonlabens sp.]|uniref:hypothetical protein n=1 Tax=Nonlabens sp. TaxID=1888209 RepID=UPI0025CD05C4|nr:hypothetical protein [Nonlabens sp.]